MRVWKDVGDNGSRCGGYDCGDYGEEPGGSHAFEFGVVGGHTSLKVTHVGSLRRALALLKTYITKGR